MQKYISLSFWDYATERALKTAIQALFVSGLIGYDGATGASTVRAQAVMDTNH